MTNTNERPACYRLVSPGFHGNERTVLEIVRNVTVYLPKPYWTSTAVLETKETWTSAEVMELIVELFDLDKTEDRDR